MRCADGHRHDGARAVETLPELQLSSKEKKEKGKTSGKGKAGAKKSTAKKSGAKKTTKAAAKK